MKLKRGKKNTYTYNRKGLSQWSAVGTLMHVGSKTFGERQLEIFEVGVSLRCQFFSDIFTKQPHPLPA